jgi:hypothetical protein
MQVRVIDILADGMAVLQVDGRRRVWTRVRLRKPRLCSATQRTLPTGSLAYRPVSNGDDRMLRVSAAVVDGSAESGA